MGVKGKNNYQAYKGIDFKNEYEVEFYKKLEKLKEDGHIYDFEFEVLYIFFEEGVDFRGKKIKPITHTPDFKVWITKDRYMVIDVKGGGASQIEETAQIKAKILQLNEHPLEYYMVSRIPKYLYGGKGENVWFEISKGYDFLTKLKSKYGKLYPDDVKKHWSKKRNMSVTEWKNYFNFHDVLGLFYAWDKTLTKKEIEKRLKSIE